MSDRPSTTYDMREMMIMSQWNILRPYTTWLCPPETQAAQINHFRLREGKCHEHTYATVCCVTLCCNIHQPGFLAKIWGR